MRHLGSRCRRFELFEQLVPKWKQYAQQVEQPRRSEFPIADVEAHKPEQHGLEAARAGRHAALQTSLHQSVERFGLGCAARWDIENYFERLNGLMRTAQCR